MTHLVLAIETSTPVASVAVLRGSSLLAAEQSPSSIRHDQLLLPRIDQTLTNAGVHLRDVNLFAIGLGPGGFGGLRVGLATMKGLALATRTPIIGVGSLLALANGAPTPTRWVLAVVDAYRGELYASLFERGPHGLREAIAPFNATPTELVARVRAVCEGDAPYVLGDGLRAHEDILRNLWPALVFDLNAGAALPNAFEVGRLGLEQWTQHGPADLASLLPIYIRESDAKLPPQPLQLSPEQE